MKTAVYKGRTYVVLWSGDTKYGKRAHLRFRDGSRDFWVDASSLSNMVVDNGGHEKSRSSGGMCDECGERRAVTTGHDSSGISGRLCASRASMPSYMRSFA